MVRRRRYGLWLAAGAIFMMQAGVAAPERRVVSGPSQGPIPAPVILAAATAGGGGGLGASQPPTSQRESGGGGSASPAPSGDRGLPVQSRPRGNTSPPAGGGGGGNSMVVPVMRGNPDGLDAVSDPSPSPDENGGGGGGATSPNDGPFIRVLPGGDAADWARSPSPSTR